MKRTFLLLLQGKGQQRPGGQEDHSDKLATAFLTLGVSSRQRQETEQLNRTGKMLVRNFPLHYTRAFGFDSRCVRMRKRSKGHKGGGGVRQREDSLTVLTMKKDVRETKLKRNTQRPSCSTSEVVCGSSVVT